MAYLDDNKPARSQFSARRRKPTGLIVVHSAENLPDVKPPDTGAENVARQIQRRSDPGSYHWLCDYDSRINLVRMEMAAFGDGTGSNHFAIHVSGAFQAHQWPSLPAEWREGCLRQMAAACRESMLWLKSEHGIDVPVKRITRAESEAGMAGFISHGERDPGRRSDPGPNFDWPTLLKYLTAKPSAPTEENEDMSAYIVELFRSEYKKFRGQDYEPERDDLPGWQFWMDLLAQGKDVNGNNADSYTILQGMRWIIAVNEKPRT